MLNDIDFVFNWYFYIEMKSGNNICFVFMILLILLFGICFEIS